MSSKVRQGFDKTVKKFKGVLNHSEDPIKKSCLVLAIMNMVANGLLFLSCLYVEYRIYTYKPPPSRGFLLGGIRWGARNKRDAIDDHIRGEGWFPTLWLIMIVTAVFSIATIIFSALICRGILKRRPGLVQAYFVYGVIVTIMIVLVSVLHLFIGDTVGTSIGGLVGCVLHSAYLVLVYKTFKKLQQEVRCSIPIIMQEIDISPSAPPFEDISITEDEIYYSASESLR